MMFSSKTLFISAFALTDHNSKIRRIRILLKTVPGLKGTYLALEQDGSSLLLPFVHINKRLQVFDPTKTTSIE